VYYQLDRSKVFLKDYSRCKISDKQYSKFIVFIGKLLAKEDLPLEARDHSLKGDWIDFREFHVSGDLIVIYKIKDEVLYLTRIGTHSQIFG